MSRSNLKKKRKKKKVYVKIKCYLLELKYLESWRDFQKSDQMVCILITIGSPLGKFQTYIYILQFQRVQQVFCGGMTIPQG